MSERHVSPAVTEFRALLAARDAALEQAACLIEVEFSANKDEHRRLQIYAGHIRDLKRRPYFVQPAPAVESPAASSLKNAGGEAAETDPIPFLHPIMARAILPFTHSPNCPGCARCCSESMDKRAQWERDAATGARDPDLRLR